MFPWSRSQELMESSMRSVRQPTTTHYSQRRPSFDVDDMPSCKRLRRASDFEGGRPTMANDSLVSHLAHAAISNEATFADLMGQNSSMQFQLWPTRRASTSSLANVNRGPGRYYNESMAGHSQNAGQPRLSFVNSLTPEGDGSFDGMPHHYVTHAGVPSGFQPEPPVRRGTFPRYPPISSPGVAMMHPNQGYPMEFSEHAWIDPQKQHQVRRPSLMMQPTMHSMPSHSFPDSGVWFGDDEAFSPSRFHDMDPVVPTTVPVILALPEDRLKLSAHQVFLRYQIEAFKATEEDVTTHTRGRNKRIQLGQVGIRCRHCAHVPVAMRQKGSVYYPSTMLGLYQAAQNISATHLQCGLCAQTPEVIKRQFVALLSTRAFSSGAGRPYWAQSAKKLGLIDTPNGIRFAADVTPESSEEGATSSITTEESPASAAIP